MFEHLIERNVVVYLLDIEVSGIVVGEQEGFLKIKEIGLFDLSYIRIKDINIIRCLFCDSDSEEESFCCEKQEKFSPNRMAAVVTKKHNDFSMNLPTAEQGSYKYPEFVRKTGAQK